MGRQRSAAGLGRVAREPALRRLLAGFLAFSFSEHATWLAMLVYALEQDGAAAVGVVALAQLLPSVVLAPLAAYGGDRFPPHRAIATSYALQCLSMVATAVSMAAGATLAAYVAGGLAATCITFTRPVMGTLLPRVTHAPSDLVAANVATGLVEQVGVLAGPLTAGALMAVSSPTTVFAAAAVATAIACASALTVEPVEPFRPDADLDAGTVVARALAGFVTLRRHAAVRAVVILGAAGGIVKGIGDVIFVTFADDRLDGGGGQSGLLAGAYGVGAIAGAAATTRLVHGRSVARQFTAAGLLAAVPLVGLAGVEALGPALVAFAVLGAGETLLQLTSTVTLQRLAPPAVLARLFGILEGIVMGCIALGSIAVTAFVSWTSVTTSFVLLAALVVAAVLLGVVLLVRAGGQPPPVDADVIERILADDVFAPLPAPTVERLGRVAEHVHAAPGDVVVAEGEVGDRYYLVCDGVLTVTMLDQHVRSLDAGDAFGEIALLRDMPRTATVTAQGPVELLAVARDDFLEAVTGHPRSLRAAEATADRWLA